MKESNSKLKLLAAEIRSQRAAELHERKPWERGWRLSLPGYELTYERRKLLAKLRLRGAHLFREVR
jgi:hypothetical protein